MPLIYQSDNSSNSLHISNVKVKRKYIKDAYFATREEEKKENGIKVKFKRLKEAFTGEQVYIIVKTEDARHLELNANIKQGKDKGITEVDSPIKVQQDEEDVLNIKMKVGNYCEEKNIINQDDFLDLAIAKIILSPKTEEDQKEWSISLNKLTDKKTKLYILIDAHSKNDYYITYYGRNPNDEGKPDYKSVPNRWLDMDGKWFELSNNRTINIYHDGKITNNYIKDTEKIKYVYHDKDNCIHDIGAFDISEVDKLKKGKSYPSGFYTDKVAIETITYDEEGVDAEESRQYANGDIITKGTFRIKYRRYLKDEGKILLVKMTEVDYSKGDLKIKFEFHETLRHYANPILFAGFIGALADCSLEGIKSTGSSYGDASCYPSTTHVNGESIDTTYLSSTTDEQKFINSLYKFGFGLHYIGTSMTYTHGTPDTYHNDHLHSGSFSPNYK